jgi:HCOMODA/2-hydroxy-3-carboxy-muconic semialdehyde decarboxylase
MCASSHGKADDKEVLTAAGSRPAPAAAPQLVAALVAANHILLDQGVVDAFGHVSVRHDKQADRFLLARNMAPGLVTANDILEFDLDGNPIAAQGRAVYLERFIHGAIYRARPDVHAVVHSHSPAIIPFGVASGIALQPVWHMSAFIGEGAPIFEIRTVAGNDSDLLIRNNELGVALARSLGAHEIVLMRGHGATIVGATLPQAVFRAVYAEVNARLQAEAIRLGSVTYLTKEEARAASASTEGQLNRAWDFWRRRVEAGHG